MSKLSVLADYLGVEEEHLEGVEGSGGYYFVEGIEGEFMILTDAEADEWAAADIAENIWAFNPVFLAEQIGIAEEVFASLSRLCEDANPVILALMRGMDVTLTDIAEAACASDGRGSFISRYDDEEYGVYSEEDQQDYYIYRMN